MNNVRSLIDDFANQLAALVESQALDQARAAIESALGVRRPGRPPKATPLTLAAGLRTPPGKIVKKKARKKPPKQFCPVPGCKNVAAPVFGMVCAEHKDVAKAKIKQYREARKAKKLGIKPPKAIKAKAVKAKAAKSKATKPKATKPRAAKPRAAKPRIKKPAKPRAQKVARPKPAKRQPAKVEAPAPVAAPKPPAADAA
jgi:histone H1/5